jgi:large subunit ribosomal protein L4e
MSSIDIYDLDGKPKGKMGLPKVFEVRLRPDVISKTVIAIQSHRFQPQGRDPMAGKRTTAETVGVGKKLSRIPRVKGERHPRAGSGAFAPSTVGGRLTHPPNPQKRLRKRSNKRESSLALASAIAATANKEIVQRRGHRIDAVPSLPLVIGDDIEGVKETKDAKELLKKLGLWNDVERVIGSIKRRSGRASLRGRGRKMARGPLIVCVEDRGMISAFRNIPGVDTVRASDLNVEHLAPGTHPGRLTLWTESAVKAIDHRLKGRA